VNGYCGCGGLGAGCAADVQCCSGSCGGGACCLALGQPCAGNPDCCSGLCLDSVCVGLR
jgi:hypothetical protein